MKDFGIFALLLVIVHCHQIQLDEEWELFKVRYRKMYDFETELHRRVIWENNIALIERHNLEADMDLHTYRLGQNKYADLSHKEFMWMLTGFHQSQDRTKVIPRDYNETKASILPTTVDWRSSGYVTRVKDQAECGACWAFSATGSLEGQHFKKTRKLIELSEQNLVDCNTVGNHGCDGGNMVYAFNYIGVNDGIDTEQSYPYVAKQEVCKFRRKYVGATDTGYALIFQQESSLQAAVALEGPISVGMDASPVTFALYKSGVYSDAGCSSVALNHAVTAVGYGTQKGKDYWLLKNSWSTSWGEDGYVRLARNEGNMCGIATSASFPLV